MKKLLLLLIIFYTVSLSSFAVMTPEEAMSIDYIKNHGYSDEMARLIDLQSFQISNKPSQYKSSDPDWYTQNKKVNFIRKTFMYFDSGLDDGKFLKHNTKYTNSWSDL